MPNEDRLNFPCPKGAVLTFPRNTLPRDDKPVFENFLDNEMVEFDTGNGVDILVPSKMIEIVDYLETLQDPAPTRYVP